MGDAEEVLAGEVPLRRQAPDALTARRFQGARCEPPVLFPPWASTVFCAGLERVEVALACRPCAQPPRSRGVFAHSTPRFPVSGFLGPRRHRMLFWGTGR